MEQRHATQDAMYQATTPHAEAIHLHAPRAHVPGGFWRRVAANLIDSCIYFVLTMPFRLLFGTIAGASSALSGADPQTHVALGLAASLGSFLISAVGAFFYY